MTWKVTAALKPNESMTPVRIKIDCLEKKPAFLIEKYARNESPMVMHVYE
jgi:hypothetical protein